MTHDLRRELRAALVVIGCSLVAAGPVGVAWFLLAPLPTVVVRSTGIFLAGGGSEVAVAADGWFAVCTATAGLVAALVVFSRIRRARLGPLLGLVIGGLAGAVVAWRTGTWLGPADVEQTATGLAQGATFDAPLKLSAHGVLFAWPLTAVVAYFALTAGLEPGEAEEGRVGHRFPVTVLRPSYPVAEVDAAFARVDEGALTRDELAQVQFTAQRLRRGYDATSVDVAVRTRPFPPPHPGAMQGTV